MWAHATVVARATQHTMARRSMARNALGGWLCDCAQLRLLDQLAYFEAAANPFIDEASPNPSLVSNHAVSGNGP